MSESTIVTAAREYARRPADERFDTPQAMLAAAREQKNHSAERTYPIGKLRAVLTDRGLQLQGPAGQADMSHWAFGQLARTIGAPASYLRDGLSPDLTVAAVNHGLSKLDQDQTLQLLVQAPNGRPFPVVRCVTTEAYSRFWDADLYAPIIGELGDRSGFVTPPTWSGEPAGAYRGDRDSFLIMVNGGSIVEDPSLRNGPAGGDAMYRGIMVRNSEVGAASLVIEQILFRFICGNHMLWGAMVDRSYRRRHVGRKLTRETIMELNRIAYSWGHASAARDQAIITSLIDHELAKTKDEVIAALRNLGATEQQAIDAYRTTEATEAASPRSFWGIAQGLTRVSQTSGYQDERYAIDKIAAAVLARGRKMVAA